MKKILFISVLLFSCNRTDNCLDIRDKYEGNGQFYFELNDTRFSDVTPSDEDPYPTAIVSEEEFNQYQIGDKYCRE